MSRTANIHDWSTPQHEWDYHGNHWWTFYLCSICDEQHQSNDDEPDPLPKDGCMGPVEEQSNG